jgi:hypothetical protein
VGEPEVIAAQLNKALRRRRGVRAIALYTYARELALLIFPPELFPIMQDDDRARAAEDLIRRACAGLGDPTGRALAILCDLAPGSDQLTLDRRREKAGQILGPYGIQADTVRRPYVWNSLMLELAIAIRGLRTSSEQDLTSEISEPASNSEKDKGDPVV